MARGLASSRSQARQARAARPRAPEREEGQHPSYLVNVGEEVAIKEKMHQNTMVLEARNVAQSQNAVPWLEQEREQFKARSWRCRSAMTCKRRRSTSSSSSSYTRSKILKGAASASEPANRACIWF